MDRKKRILIDGTTISDKMDGLSRYIINVVRFFDTSKNYYTILVRPAQCPIKYVEEFKKKGIKVEFVDMAPIGPKRDWQFFWYLRKHKTEFDMMFAPSNQFPVFASTPSVYTVHDLIYERFPSQLGRMAFLKRLYLHWVVKMGVRKADHVIAVSQYTKKEILYWHPNTCSDKITVIYEGCEHLQDNIVVERKKDLPFSTYMLYVGSARGHKNLYRLLLAINLIKDKLPEYYGFMLAGNISHLTEKQQEIVNEINKNRTIVYFPGWVEEEELNALFANSCAFIFPSLSEGFGIPVLEAFYNNVPLLVSKQTSLPEVAGDAALYFDPYSVTDIAETILHFIRHEKEISADLSQKGRLRLRLFSWKKAASEIELLFAK